MEDKKAKHLIAARYLTQHYMKLFQKVNKYEVDLSTEDQTHMRVDSNFQRQCTRNVSLKIRKRSWSPQQE